MNDAGEPGCDERQGYDCGAASVSFAVAISAASFSATRNVNGIGALPQSATGKAMWRILHQNAQRKNA
jgi:hypothetical protein